MVGVADFEGDGGKGQVRCTSSGLGDHGCVGVDPDHPPLRPYSLGEAEHLVPESAAHIQDLFPLPDRADIEHLPLDLPDQGAPVHTVQPAEDGLGVRRLICRLETLMQAAHGASRRDRTPALAKHDPPACT